MSHIRPIQFTADMQIGDFPNDGIEALAFGQARTLYLGVEKDSHKQARIFSLQMHSEFWQSDEFAVVTKFALKLPVFESGNHPLTAWTTTKHLMVENFCWWPLETMKPCGWWICLAKKIRLY